MPARDGAAVLAGEFSAWLQDTRAILLHRGDADVPCGGCTACCRASQFVHVAPDEADTLAHIPPELLFPAPGLPKGHVLLGYDEEGRCPLLIDDRCSIYEHRPATCRAYDCRVFAATGISAGDAEHPVARQTVRWRFAHGAAPSAADRRAVMAAARFLEQYGELFPPGFVPGHPGRLAVLALEVYEVFADAPGASAAAMQALADAAVAAHERFRRRCGNEKEDT